MKLLDILGRIPAYLELIGLRFPVKSYQEKVSDTLWRGSRVDAAGIADLAKRGFKSIIDLTKESTGDSKIAPQLGIYAIRVPILDDSHPTFAQMDSFLSYAKEPAYLPMYVHCEAGIGRTGMAIACYRAIVQGWTPEAAIYEAEKHGLKMPNQIEFLRIYIAERKKRG